MKKRKPTINEVARLAGVGIGTVSRVLNNHVAVRDETRLRVQRAMEKLGYSPNPHARRVAGGRSYTVSVMLPFVATEFYSRLIEGIEKVLERERFELALFPLLSPRRLERYLQSDTLAYQTDGLIISSYDLAELFEDKRLPTDHPVVFVDTKSAHYDSVFMDNRLGGKIAAEHLAPLGRCFAITVEEDIDKAFNHTVFAERLAGFKQGLREMKLALPRSHVFTTRLSAEGGRLALQHFLQASHSPQRLVASRPPLSIFAGADLLALGVLEEAERLGLELGRDLLVLGYDGQPWTQEKQLSTLSQPVEAMGARAAEFLLERMKGFNGKPRTIRFEPALVERESTLLGGSTSRKAGQAVSAQAAADGAVGSSGGPD